MADFEAQRCVECREAIQELIECARQGNAKAIVELSQLAEAGYFLRSEKSSLFSLTPSLKDLLKAVRHANALDSSHRTVVNDICLELCKNLNKIDTLSFNNGDITKTPGLMSRVVLFNNELIEIRAHLFEANAQETYIHHHCQPFITTCISGSYVHRIWSIKNSESSKYYVHRRKTGGIYSEEVEAHDGELENVLCQPFECGQSLFISATAQHTVGDSKGKLVTIVVRDKLARNKDQVVDILSTTPTIEQPTEAVIKVTNESERRAILESLKDALRTLYCKKMIQEPSHELIVSARETNRGIHDILEVVQKMQRDVELERHEHAILLLDLSILLLAWTYYRKNPTCTTLRASNCDIFAMPNGCTIKAQLKKLGIDCNQPKLTDASPKSIVAHMLSQLKASWPKLATAKYILWCFGLPTSEEVTTSRFWGSKGTIDVEMGDTGTDVDYLHNELKIPRLTNSTREERQEAMVKWIFEEKQIRVEGLLRLDAYWKSWLSCALLVTLLVAIFAMVAWL